MGRLGTAVPRGPGDVPVTLTDARAKRAELWLARRQGEPLPAVGRDGKRFEVAAADYLKSHATEWGPKQLKDHERRLKLHAAALNSKPVNRIASRTLPQCFRRYGPARQVVAGRSCAA